jgi:hypothetical protein
MFFDIFIEPSYGLGERLFLSVLLAGFGHIASDRETVLDIRKQVDLPGYLLFVQNLFALVALGGVEDMVTDWRERERACELPF